MKKHIVKKVGKPTSKVVYENQSYFLVTKQKLKIVKAAENER